MLNNHSHELTFETVVVRGLNYRPVSALLAAQVKIVRLQKRGIMTSKFKADDGYKIKVTESFHRQEVMKTLNASILDIRPGEIELEFPHQQKLTQQHGFIHAGIVSTVLDSACGYAAFSLMPKEAAVLTIEFKINLLSPAKGEQFRAIGKVKKPGKYITVTEGELFAYSENSEKLVATMVGTIMTVYDREGIKQ